MVARRLEEPMALSTAVQTEIKHAPGYIVQPQSEAVRKKMETNECAQLAILKSGLVQGIYCCHSPQICGLGTEYSLRIN
jgi:hypothetical protein